METKRILFFLAFSGVWTLLLVPSIFGQKLQLSTPVKYENPRYHLPLLAAEQRGFWKEEALAVEVVAFSGSGAMYRAMAGKAINIGLAGSPGVIIAIARGIPLLMVADLQSRLDFSLWVRGDGPVRKVADLKGGAIGISRFGGQSHAYAQALIKAYGLEKQVKIVAVGGIAQEIAALRAGRIAGIMFSPDPVMDLLLKGEVRGIVSTADYLPKDWVDMVLIARRDFAFAQPDTVKRLIRALFKGASYVINNHNWSLEALKTIFGRSEAAAKLTLKELHFGTDGKINRSGLENVRRFLLEYDLLSKEEAPAVDDLYDRRFTE